MTRAANAIVWFNQHYSFWSGAKWPFKKEIFGVTGDDAQDMFGEGMNEPMNDI